MGKVALHMVKIKAGGVGGIQSHVNREHLSRTNPDIDTSRTVDNYDVLVRNDNFRRTIKKTISEFALQTKTVRKDAVVLCNFIVTSDERTMKAMSPDRQRSFFESTVQWFADRYGIQNIVYASVHMDETTPHMHVGIVPIKAGRLSAKTLFDKNELTAIQTDFAKQVGEQYGLERGREGSDATHLSETRFKAAKAAQEARQAEERVEVLQGQADALQGQIEALQTAKDVLTVEEVDAIKGNKTLLGGLKGVTYKEFDALKQTAAKVDTMAAEMNRALARADAADKRAGEAERSVKAAYADARKQIAEKVKELEAERPSLRAEVEITTLKKENASLKEKISSQGRLIDRLMEIIKEHIPSVYDKIRGSLSRSRGKSREAER